MFLETQKQQKETKMMEVCYILFFSLDNFKHNCLDKEEEKKIIKWDISDLEGRFGGGIWYNAMVSSL